MPHKCVRCGREYKDSSQDILNGCMSCGGRKFYFIREGAGSRELLAEASDKVPAAPPGEEKREILEVRSESARPPDNRERVESIRIIGPGTYELNIAKMANSDERVLGVGGDGSYVVDLLSMAKPKKKRRRKKEGK